ncbi:MAG: SDR family NAD(P)-dependent oxidoreductase [Armatimonadetes bacterium]|nr:MAG: SDR family NAD(P)-dependent oxidoreductase [Armatimonadota bacterium]
MSKLFNLSEKTSIVTGGNSGIGRGIAQALGEAGATVAVWGRSTERNAETVAAIEAVGAEAIAFSVDVSDESEVVDAFAATLDALGKVDSVFANAGLGAGSTRFHEMSTEEWRSIFGVNMEGVFWTFREALKHMQPRGEGSLVVTSSTSADVGFPRGEHYAATKAGVRALIRGIAVEYGRYGIRANAIAPGWVVTGMTDGFIEGDRFATQTLPRIPIGRFGQPDDFGGIAVYLASDASTWHTGDTITIDGGYLQS